MRPVLLVLASSALFGTTGTARALGADSVDVVSLGTARVVVGGAVLALVALLLRARAREAPARTAGPAWPAVLVGGLGVVGYQPAFFLGTERNGVALGTIVALGSAPLLTGALAWATDRRFPGPRWVVATAVAVLGLLLLAGAGAGASSVDALGLAGSLGAGLSYAVYTLASKRLLDAGWSGATTMGAVFGSAAVLGLGVLLTTDLGWLATGSGAATVLWLGLVTVAVAYLLFAAGLAALPAPTVSTLTLAEPVTATLLGLVVLGERLDLASWFGLVAIGLGIVVLAVRPRRPVAVVPA